MIATEMEAMREHARNTGDRYPDRAWILGAFDVWVRNPHYCGPDAPHPETLEQEDVL